MRNPILQTATQSEQNCLRYSCLRLQNTLNPFFLRKTILAFSQFFSPHQGLVSRRASHTSILEQSYCSIHEKKCQLLT